MGCRHDQRGSTTQLVLQLKVTSGDPITAAASVATLDQTDPDPDDNHIAAEIVPVQADLAVTTSVSDATPDVGDVVAFTVTLTNGGSEGRHERPGRRLAAGRADICLGEGRTSDLRPGDRYLGRGPARRGGVHDPDDPRQGRLADAADQHGVPVASADQFDPDTTNNWGLATETPRQAALAVTWESTTPARTSATRSRSR